MSADPRGVLLQLRRELVDVRGVHLSAVSFACRFHSSHRDSSSLHPVGFAFQGMPWNVYVCPTAMWSVGIKSHLLVAPWLARRPMARSLVVCMSRSCLSSSAPPGSADIFRWSSIELGRPALCVSPSILRWQWRALPSDEVAQRAASDLYWRASVANRARSA